MGILEPQHIIVFLLFLFIIFIIQIYIIRAILGIPKFLKYQKAQTLLLIEMANKQQVYNGIIEALRSELYAN